MEVRAILYENVMFSYEILILNSFEEGHRYVNLIVRIFRYCVKAKLSPFSLSLDITFGY